MDTLDKIIWPILLVVAGCGFVVLEVFFPSFGVLSVLALLSFVSGILVAFYNGGVGMGATFVLVVLIAGPAALIVAVKYLPSTPWGKRLLGQLSDEELEQPEDPRRALIGQIGIARTKMLPSGTVEIAGTMIDAVARGQAVEPGDHVKVVEVQGNRVAVRKTSDPVVQPTAETEDLLSRSIEELGIESIDN